MTGSRTAPFRGRSRVACVVLLLAVPPLAHTRPMPSGGTAHDLAIRVEADASTVVTGDDVAITMVATNNGPDVAVNIDVETDTPAGTAFVSASTTKGFVEDEPPAGGAGFVEVELGDLAAGESQTVTIVLDVVAEPGATIRMTGRLDIGFPEGDTNHGNNAATVEIAVVESGAADLTLAVAGETDVAGADSLFTYTAVVRNGGPGATRRDAAEGVLLETRTPDGALFASISLSQGTAETPPPLAEGPVTVRLGSLAEGSSATVALTIVVAARPGDSLSLSASVASQSADPNPGDNGAEVVTAVVASGTAALAWEEPEPPTPALPLPPPRRLVVTSPAGAAVGGPGTVDARRLALTGYNVYRSNRPGTTATPGNLFTSVPPNQTTAAAPAAPGGTFYVITAVYDEGESGPSNEGSADVPAATIASVKIKPKKIVATGTGFTDEVIVLVDGIPFVAPAKVKKNNSTVVQKGVLLTGQTIAQYLSAHPSVLVGFRNSNGGIATVRHPP